MVPEPEPEPEPELEWAQREPEPEPEPYHSSPRAASPTEDAYEDDAEDVNDDEDEGAGCCGALPVVAGRPPAGVVEKYCARRCLDRWRPRGIRLDERTSRLRVARASSRGESKVWDLRGAEVEQGREGRRRFLSIRVIRGCGRGADGRGAEKLRTHKGDELKLAPADAELRRWKHALRRAAARPGRSATTLSGSPAGSLDSEGSWPSSSSADESEHSGSSEDDSDGGRFPLPPGWTVAKSHRSGHRYWVNRGTGEQSRSHPGRRRGRERRRDRVALGAHRMHEAGFNRRRSPARARSHSPRTRRSPNRSEFSVVVRRDPVYSLGIELSQHATVTAYNGPGAEDAGVPLGAQLLAVDSIDFSGVPLVEDPAEQAEELERRLEMVERRTAAGDHVRLQLSQQGGTAARSHRRLSPRRVVVRRLAGGSDGMQEEMKLRHHDHWFRSDGAHRQRRRFGLDQVRGRLIIEQKQRCCCARETRETHSVVEVQADSVATNPLGFTVHTAADRTIVIVATDQRQKDRWVQALRSASRMHGHGVRALASGWEIFVRRLLRRARRREHAAAISSPFDAHGVPLSAGTRRRMHQLERERRKAERRAETLQGRLDEVEEAAKEVNATLRATCLTGCAFTQILLRCRRSSDGTRWSRA